MRRLLAILLAFVLIAAACGDDSGTAPADAESNAETSADEPEPTDEPADEPEPADDPEPTPDIELTDSYRGVTTDSITIGVAYIDAQRINELFNIDLGITPVEEMYAAWSAALNDRGGINGRDVLIESGTFLPVGAAESDAICLEFMEDKEIFVVIGQFLQDNALCITEANGHPYVGHFGETPERQRRSGGLFFGLEINQVSQRVGGTQAMIEDGVFDDKRVAVVWQDPTDAQYAEAVLPVLATAGINVVEEVEVGAASTDDIDNDAKWDITIERFISSDIDIILNLSGIVGVLDAVGRAEFEVEIAHTNGQTADGTTIIEESTSSDEVRGRSFAATTFKPNLEESLADPEVQRCIAEFQAAFPDIEPDLENSDWVGGFTNQCRAFAFTVLVLETAGGDITPDTFVSAAEGLGEFSLPAMPEASIGPDKHSAGSALVRYVYDVEGAQYVRSGDSFIGAELG
ncbi:MAG: hypothetical protein ACI9C1_002569 [Candidatus Aldehydirespiratoraceae bacterium]|jgi:hypothetical protein